MCAIPTACPVDFDRSKRRVHLYRCRLKKTPAQGIFDVRITADDVGPHERRVRVRAQPF